MSNKPKQLRVLLEHDSGTMEVFLGVTEQGDQAAFRPLCAVAQSGKLQSFDAESILEAVHLLCWTEENQCVFDGRVSQTSQTANSDGIRQD